MISAKVIAQYLRPPSSSASDWDDSVGEIAWLCTGAHDYVNVKVVNRSGAAAKATIQFSDGRTDVVSGDSLFPVNSARYEKCEDMGEMSELNEATVLENLRKRYQASLSYTYSALFLVAINPYRLAPIYDSSVADYYRQQRRTDRPPHIFAIADGAYRGLVESGQCQSILITGESGAGKTENTKWVIQYLAHIAGSTMAEDRSERDISIQLVQANPILEAFGNAQTVRNNNSSRFGKFVRIEFGSRGTILGAHIEHYLLEKSRVTHRSLQERSFHVFYQLLAGASAEAKASLYLSDTTAADYAYLKDSNIQVAGVNDASDFAALLKAMSALGFSASEQASLFSILASILHLGNLRFIENEQNQAELANPPVAQHVCDCLGIKINSFLDALLRPVVRAGKDELVAQARSVDQVVYSVEALARTLYERMFAALVERINTSISSSSSNSISSSGGAREAYANGTAPFIGVLDMAGFEIFEKNSFEQLCINHTNEKLQQFFNHHMFIREQEEYRQEGINWQYIDFGLDLQPTIDLIERANPIGLLACLDEDSLMPKATDRSFCEKACALWKGRSDKFEPSRFGDGFTITHYAGRVEYCTDGWLVKNKDPLNEPVVRLLARSDSNFVARLFGEFVGSDEQVYQATKGTRRGQFRTVAQKHRESLAMLMQTLNGTQPHFVRCIVPNDAKLPGRFDVRLVLDQLRCNGVLEGIRICRLGFPTRIPYPEFVRRYQILLPANSSPLLVNNKSNQNLARDILTVFGMTEKSEFCLGTSKLFLRAGELSKLDEAREQKIASILTKIQAACKYALARKHRNRRAKQLEAVEFLQRNIKIYLNLRQWPWWKLYARVKPLLNVTRTENRIEELERELEKLGIEKDQQLGQLRVDLEHERNLLFDAETRKRDLERHEQQLSIQLVEASDTKTALTERIMQQDIELVRLKDRLANELEVQREQLQGRISSLEKDQVELQKALSEQKITNSNLKARGDEIEFERIKLEKNESCLRTRVTDLEGVIEESKRSKRDLEFKIKQMEESCKALQERLDDESAMLAQKQEMQAQFEAQMRSLQQKHVDELAEAEEEWEAARKRFSREIHQITFDYEQEKKTNSTLRETVKRYEDGADNLANQLEAEMRNQNAWKREKERLEARLKDTVRIHQESVEREDALQAQISALHEQLRDLRSKLMDAEEVSASTERAKKSLEARYDNLNENLREVLSARQSAEKSNAALEGQVVDLMNKLSDEQDAGIISKEQMKTLENMLKLTQIEVENQRRQHELLAQEKVALEVQVKELQLKLLESETSSPGIASRTARRPSSTYNQIMSVLENEGIEKQNLLLASRKQERTLKDLYAQLMERDRQRISFEESQEKGELKLRKLQTTLEAMETRTGELEVAKRRLERDLLEEREKCDRLQREYDRVKGKVQQQASSITVMPGRSSMEQMVQ